MAGDYYIGVMSGTSLDGVDCAIVDFAVPQQLCQVIHARTYAIPDHLKATTEQLCTPGNNEIDTMGALDRQLGILYADSINQLLQEAKISHEQIRAIGCHGQTIRHRPTNESDKPAFTLQIGDPNSVAYGTRITTVADFRRKDIAAGGQGAPLVPPFHAALFNNHPDYCIVNIGGIANITIMQREQVRGFDTGPGNLLIDYWCYKNFGAPFDHHGKLAAKGQVDHRLLEHLQEHPFFYQQPPKSTGREDFNPEWLERALHPFPQISELDVLATLTALTAWSISYHVLSANPSCKHIAVCGGGAHNDTLMQHLAEHCPEQTVTTTDAFGIHSDWMEAAAFAWLARQRIQNLTSNATSVTGAHSSEILGAIYAP